MGAAAAVVATAETASVGSGSGRDGDACERVERSAQVGRQRDRVASSPCTPAHDERRDCNKQSRHSEGLQLCLPPPTPKLRCRGVTPSHLLAKRRSSRRRISLPERTPATATIVHHGLPSPLRSPAPPSSPSPEMRASARTFVSCLAISRLDLSVVYVSSPADVSKSIRKRFCPYERAEASWDRVCREADERTDTRKRGCSFGSTAVPGIYHSTRYCCTSNDGR